MNVILVRHGETDGNISEVLQGQSVDSELNSEGARQVENIVPRLEDIGVDLIFSSPLKRARQSAEIINQRLNVPIKFDKRILERDYGALGGKSKKDAAKFAGVSEEELQKMRKSNEYDFRPYGGESAEDVEKRLKKFLKDIKKEYSGKTVLVVTHGGVIRRMHGLYSENQISSHEKLPNASIHAFDI